jgi:hypothetical protein
MQFIDIPTEQTTAITDLVLTLFSVWALIIIHKRGKSKPGKSRIWKWVFTLLAIAAFFGFLAHGFQMNEKTNYLLWQPLNLALGLSVSLFAAGAIFDMRKGNLPRAIVPGLITLGIIFYFITVFIPGSFMIFIIYEAVVMIFALTAYIYLASKKLLTGAWWMVTGIVLTITAAAVQASGSVRVNMIWEFDNNGVFHIIQMIGIVVLVNGLLIDFRSKKPLKYE